MVKPLGMHMKKMMFLQRGGPKMTHDWYMDFADNIENHQYCQQKYGELLAEHKEDELIEEGSIAVLPKTEGN
jgi:hypothetical protein